MLFNGEFRQGSVARRGSFKARLAAWLCALTCAWSPAGGQGPAPPETAARKAGKLYTTAVSAYRTGQWDQARVLLEQFVRVYATHEYVPVAYLQLAYCRSRLKDFEGYQAALDSVIGRFAGSPAWFCAYGAKLDRAKAGKDPDGYLALLEAMVRSARQAPLNLHGSISRYYGDYVHGEYSSQGLAFEPVAGRMGSITRQPGWVMNVAQIADTPPRAEKALSILADTLQKRSGELPPDWQFAHVLLLQQAGKSDEANEKLREYLDAWQRAGDPRGIDLWLLQLGRAPNPKQTTTAPAEAKKDPWRLTPQEIFSRLITAYGGAGELEEPIRQRLGHLYHRDEYAPFAQLAGHYLRTYTTSRYFDHVVGLWVGLAKGRDRKGDPARIADALKMLDEAAATEHPPRLRANLIRKIDLHVLAGRPDRAAELAMKLIAPDQWSAESFQLISRYARDEKAFAKVLDAARGRWKIPLPDPAGKAFVLLNQLKFRLKDDQVRHAEEIGEEIFARHRDDASTIEALKLLSDYYFNKVLPEPRDKWMARMIESYPQHPLTQAVLANQVTAERAARRYDRLAGALDKLAERFPPAAAHWGWFRDRESCHNAEKDAEGRSALVRRFYGARARAGEVEAIGELTRVEHARFGQDNRAVGDDWMARAKAAAGTRLELYCLAQAWSAYYWSPYYHHRRMDRICWAEAQQVIAALQSQKLDPVLRWKMALADINLLAHKGDGRGALAAIDERIAPDQAHRDLSLRLDFAAVGSALGKDRLGREGINLARRLTKSCPTSRDAGAVELMLAAMHAAAKDHPGAARHYLRIVEACPWPIRRYAFFGSAISHLRQGRSPQYVPEVERYMRRIARVQEKVPELMYQLGYSYLGAGNRGALEMLNRLATRYPASAARDRLATEIARRARQ